MRFLVSAIFAALISFHTAAGIEVPLALSPASKDGSALRLKVVNAEALLSAGLAVSAAENFKEILADGDLVADWERRVRVGLSEAYLSQNKFAQARAQLSLIPKDQQNDACRLLGALATYGKSREVDWIILQEQLVEIEVSELKDVHQYWYYLLKALEAEQKGEAGAVERFLAEGLRNAENAYQRASLQAIGLRGEMQGPALESDILKGLKRDLNQSRGAASFAYAKQYALALWNNGETEAALDLLDLEKQLKRFGLDFSLKQREQLRLLRAMMLGENSTDGQMALAELIRSGSNIEVMEVALYLLSRQSEASAIFTDLLNEILGRQEAHALIGQMYYLRSQLALRRGELELAKADAALLLEKFPGLSRIGDAYFILAYAALQDDPPRYRTAADFLIQHRDGLADEARSAESNVLIGDCYYMNGDYNNAAEFYLLALAVRPEALESIFLRVAIASIRAGRLDDALRYIDEMPIGNLAGAEKRWQAEWNIAHALILEKRAEEAIERIQQLNTNQAELSSSLNLRMRWLELNLAIDLKKVPLDASLQVDQLIAQLSDVLLASNGSLEVDAEIEVLAAELLFLKARIAYLDDGIESADASLLELRQNYNASMAAQRSYLLEAAELERRGQLEEAQVAMLNLADKYPESSLAPQSIFEAALICERRGVDHYVETVQLYERLTDRFPDDVLVYRARLRQGDLLRLLNDFAGARLIYETLANTYPEHPLRHFSELSRAQCMLALAKKDPAKLAKAGSVLERLVDLPDLDLNFRVEAMFKWAFALEGQGAKDQARAVLTQSVARNLLDIKSASALNSTGRYWAARTLLELGERLSSRDEFEEAKTIYHKLIAYNLPGRGLAQSRINSIRINNN